MMNTMRNVENHGKRRNALTLPVDIPLLLAVLSLLIFGLLIVFSASHDYSLRAFDDAGYILQRQLMWLAVGVVVAIVATLFDYHYWRAFAVPLMGFTVFALIAVFVVGQINLGAKRALSSGSFTPSELAKLVTVLYLAVWLYSKRHQIKDISFGLLPLGTIVGVISGLIMAQPDLSAAATIVFLGGLLFFFAGGDLKQILLLLLIVTAVGYVVLQVHPTGSDRISSYVDGVQNPLESGYHVQRSIEAFVKGGFWGVGIGNSTTKFLGLPVPWTDSVFAVVAEETGWLGASSVVILFSIILWRGMRIAQNAPDLLGSLMASGLTIWIVVEAFINMAVMVGLVPFAGNALPFVSAGGSSLIVTLLAIGILLNIDLLSRRERQSQQTGVNTVYASDGMRRSQRRRSVSRPRSAASAERE